MCHDCFSSKVGVEVIGRSLRVAGAGGVLAGRATSAAGTRMMQPFA